MYILFMIQQINRRAFQALTANFLGGCARRFLISFKVLIPLSCLESALRIARVFFGLRSRGLYFLFFKKQNEIYILYNTKDLY